ncbi:DUF6191 domain-containing protein [Spirillospora sp. NPDC029432]|uniref:DUF6191 domain-containing protein n=1 Tax=Spirillospora sp. NPDC029432 TaxID=3154599 RepID=UPI003452CEE6
MTTALSLLAIVSIPGLVIGLVCLAVIDRVGTAANTRFRLPWRRTADGRPLAATGFEEFHAVYFASKRHDIDERHSSLVRRDEEGDGAPPIDLDAGTATIRRPG